jgi:ABC-type multidrug transport system fused ATPase/permease subunit
MGRILNRFTYDMEVMDITLTQNMGMFLISTGWYVTGVVIMFTILPWTALAVVPVSLLYVWLVMHYRMSGPDLQRLDASSRSPVQAMVSEGTMLHWYHCLQWLSHLTLSTFIFASALDGAPTIRVFRRATTFISKFRRAVDQNSAALLNYVTAQRWLGVRIELLGSIVVLAATVLIVCLNDVLSLGPGIRTFRLVLTKSPASAEVSRPYLALCYWVSRSIDYLVGELHDHAGVPCRYVR